PRCFRPERVSISSADPRFGANGPLSAKHGLDCSILISSPTHGQPTCGRLLKASCLRNGRQFNLSIKSTSRVNASWSLVAPLSFPDGARPHSASLPYAPVSMWMAANGAAQRERAMFDLVLLWAGVV